MRNDGVRRYISGCIAADDVLSADTYKQIICELVKGSSDLEYLKAVFSFADSHPDRTAEIAFEGGGII